MIDHDTSPLLAQRAWPVCLIFGILGAGCDRAPTPRSNDPGDPARIEEQDMRAAGGRDAPDASPNTPRLDLELVQDASRPSPLDKIKLPRGFDIRYYARDVPAARSMTLSPSGTLFVGTRRDSRVWALRDEDGDQVAEKRILIAEGLNTPNGVAFHDGALYVAEVSRILRFPDIEEHLDAPPAPEVVYDQYPSDPSHGWKYIAFGPDGALYVPVGAPCNVCERDDAIYSTITRLPIATDGKASGEPEVYAAGVRNSVGFDWHPDTKELWFTDNGRDQLGDDIPPDELNRAPRKGLHFGFPYCHGGDIPDPDLGSTTSCSEFEKPLQKLGPHVAALGMRFYTGSMFPAGFEKQVFIAEHGSWNRSIPIGYRITLVEHDGEQGSNYQVFASGWLSAEGDKSGRPVDLLVMPDGALLVSDDMAGAIYRISYRDPS